MRAVTGWAARHSHRVHLLGLIAALAYAVLALCARTPAGPSLSAFFSTLGVTTVTMLGVWRWGRFSGLSLRNILGWALVFRALGFLGEPIFEDDFYRYLWDGYRTATAGDPYAQAPEAFFIDPSVPRRFQAILGQINYPEVPTIYGPALQYLFALCYFIAPGELWPLKLLLGMADMALVGLLSRIATPASLLLYAWNPLVIKEIAFTAHPDGLLPLLLIAAWLCARSRRAGCAAALLACAVATKLPALLLVPWVLLQSGRGAYRVFGLTLAALYLPLLAGGRSEWAGLEVFAQQWEFNSALYGLLTLAVTPPLARVLLAAGVLAGVAALYWRSFRLKDADDLPRGDLIFGLLILAAPVINPWYWLWVLPFSVVYGSTWSWTASVALLMAYVTGLNLTTPEFGAYEHPPWLRWVEFGAIGLAGISESLRHQSDSTRHRCDEGAAAQGGVGSRLTRPH